MTLIGAFTVNGSPVLFGDVLVTREGPPSSSVKLPTVGDVNARLSDEFAFHVAGLCQKVNLITPKHAVAWCGSAVQARAALRELRDVVDREPNKASAVADYFTQLPEREREDLSILALTLSDGQVVTIYFMNAATAQEAYTMNIRLAGSGALYGRAFFERIASGPLPEVDQAAPPFVPALGTGLTIASQAIGRELTSGGTLIERWGGAIEISFLNGNGFQKLDNVLYLTLSCELAADRLRINAVPHVIKCSYQQLDLVCRTVRLIGEIHHLRIAEDQIVVVPPMGANRGFGPHPSDRPSLDYYALCTYIGVNEASGPNWSTSLVTFCGDDRRPVRITESGDRVNFEFSDRFIERIRNCILPLRNPSDRLPTEG